MILTSTTLVLAGLAASSPAMPPASGVESASATTATVQDDEELPPLRMDALSFADARSRAERLGKMMVIFWSRENDPKTKTLKNAVLDDAEVRRWIQEHAVAAVVDVDVHELDAQRNRIGVLQTPCIDIFSLTRGGRIDRLVYGSDALDFLAGVLGQTDGVVVTRPEGEFANEPFRWLAWGNECYRREDEASGAEAVWAYEWCLNTADAIRPSFRARYFEFLVRRVIQCKVRTTEAIPTLEAELERLAKLLLAGKATRRDAYECSRLIVWLDISTRGRTLMAELAEMGDERRQERLWLLGVTAPKLGEHREYGPILATVKDDSRSIFLARAEQLRRAAEAAAKMPGESSDEGAEKAPEIPKEIARFIQEPLDYSVPDTRAELLEDAAWVFEALIHDGQVDSARALQLDLAALFPKAPRAYALFMERAMRLGRYDVAAEIGDAGVATLDARGAKRVQRLLASFPADDGK